VLQHAAAAEAGLETMKKGARDRVLQVEATGGAESARRTLGRALDLSAKKWELLKASSLPNGNTAIEYRVRLRKSADPADFVANFRAAAGATVVRAELADEVRAV
jgi:hypothetical protein